MTEPDPFAEIVGADQRSRRSALDALPVLDHARDRASVLVLLPDGQVDALAVLAGPDGPTRHARRLDPATVEQLARSRPPRWAAVT